MPNLFFSDQSGGQGNLFFPSAPREAPPKEDEEAKALSQLEARGVTILRREEVVQGQFGPVHCCRYWLAPESFDRARELLGLPRGAP